MKVILFASLLLQLSSVLASTTPQQNQERLDFLMNHRVGAVWTCAKGDNPEAVVMFNVDPRVSGAISGTTPLAIQDQAICDALKVTCPFVANASPYGRDYFPASQYVYWATRGKYEDTVAFFSEGTGMKLISIGNGLRPTLYWERNWFFNAGECNLHY